MCEEERTELKHPDQSSGIRGSHLSTLLHSVYLVIDLANGKHQ